MSARLDTKLARSRAAQLKKQAARAGKNLDVRYGDIRDASFIRHAVLECGAVIHHAAILPPKTEQSPELAQAINVGGTECVLRAIEEMRTPARLVFPSSVSVHGHRSQTASCHSPKISSGSHPALDGR